MNDKKGLSFIGVDLRSTPVAILHDFGRTLVLNENSLRERIKTLKKLNLGTSAEDLALKAFEAVR